MHGTHKHAWRTQATWAKIPVLGKLTHMGCVIFSYKYPSYQQAEINFWNFLQLYVSNLGLILKNVNDFQDDRKKSNRTVKIILRQLEARWT